MFGGRPHQLVFVQESGGIRKSCSGAVPCVDDDKDDGAEEKDEEGEGGHEDPHQGPLLHPKAGRQVLKAWQLQGA